MWLLNYNGKVLKGWEYVAGLEFPFKPEFLLLFSPPGSYSNLGIIALEPQDFQVDQGD